MESSTRVEKDEPLTPAGRLFLSPQMDQVINCAIGFKNPVNVEAIKTEVKNSLLIQHPRFSSLLIKNSKGREKWRNTHVEVDKHFIVVDSQSHQNENHEDEVNNYLADLSVSSPLSTDKPLWEIHVLMAQQCLVLRIHHALGDGVSLMSLFLACCKRADGQEQEQGDSTSRSSGERRRGNWRVRFWGFLVMVWLSLVYCLEFVMRSLWVRDKKSGVNGGAGVELWPRKLATARFKIDDLKAVKIAFPNATINDVLFGVISSGLSRYLDLKSSKDFKSGEMEKLMKTKSGSRWGNRFGIFLLPVYYHKGTTDPLEYVRRAKKIMDRKKQSLEAHFSYAIGNLVMTLFGPEVACWLNYRIICNTTFTFSNVVGPKKELLLAENPITFLRVTSSALPHAITMHMVSYAGIADLQISVAKDIIPEPKILAKCFEDALMQMKDAALANT
ncbi:O-acyltransferase, WSD1-like, N-terminal [Dillenia turbinata]|uniref:O-acyltransferase, WSD1-like, N-terminal n=1 Tax=Dillenia turbinata TaxID=194707 RepID=A0AAN8WDU3_9MAGN